MPPRPPVATAPIVPPPRGPSPAATLGVVELTDQTFVPYINGHPFAVVDLCAPSSVPSRTFAPTFAAAAARHPDALFVKVDAEQQRAVVAQFNLRSIPTLLIIRSNIVVFAKAGGLQARELDDALAAARALDMDQVRRKATTDAGQAEAPPTGSQPQAAPDAGPLSIESFLRPSVRAALADAGPRLAAGGLVSIPDAFDAEFAERMHRSLDRCTTWRVHENYAERFAYHHHNLYHPEDFPEDLTWCSKVFDSQASKAWATRLSGRTCLGPTSILASWYLPGRPFAAALRQRHRPARTSSASSRSSGISRRTGAPSGAARSTGVRRRRTCRRVQHVVSLQRDARVDPLRDAGLAVRARQAPHDQRLVDGTDADRRPGLDRAGPGRRRRDGDRDLLRRAVARGGLAARRARRGRIDHDVMKKQKPTRIADSQRDQTQLAALEMVFTPEECMRLIADYKPLLQPALVDTLDLADSASIRKSSAVFIFPNKDTSWVFERIGTAIREINDTVYGFATSQFREGFQFTCYQVGEFYGPHFDLGPGRLAERKLSLTVQLSPPEDYTGGELLIYPEFVAPKDQGTMTVFPSFMCHSVNPVTSGVRYSLVSWLAGPPFR